jgi:type IV fimbrial biogenesis protein FimT
MTNKFQSGITLLELISSISILSIITTLAAPSFSSWIDKQEADTQAFSILRLFAKTREIAVYSGKSTFLCGINSANKCVRENFNHFVIFHDDNNNRIIDNGEIIQAELTLHDNNRISMNKTHIRYYPRGDANAYASVFICSDNKQHIRRVTVSNAGRPYIARPSGSGEVLQADDNTPINCANPGSNY